MATKKSKGLGMGLEALLGPKVSDTPAAAASEGSPTTLRLDLMQAGKYQPRTRMDEGSLYELAESIRSQGIMQPILVRPIGEGRYEIIAGERRSRAAKLAGLSEVPVLVKDVPDEAAAAMALIENIQREDLNPLEEAQALQRLIDEFDLTHAAAAEAVGRSRAAVSNLLRLLELPAEIRALVQAGQLEMGAARALLPLAVPMAISLARQAAEHGWSVREVEHRVQQLSTGKAASTPRKPAAKAKPQADIVALERELSEALGTRIDVLHGRGGKGRLVIHYSDLESLDGVLERLRTRA